ncbi:hypothetical protein SDC9_88608 [bioreactor metagenome]|uniref:RiboL-PSP-HEPN domain-containing protein n=1 Tax=bioreactor metagenome TaxID=1076179 RepID=A0A644ZME2_9ZZZZ
MNNSLDLFHSSISDTLSLLQFITPQTDAVQQKVVFRSSIVLLVASWEQFIEQLAVNSNEFLLHKLRNSSSIPEGVKQKIAFYSVREDRSNPLEFSNSVWQFSDLNWKQTYAKFCLKSTKALNTASPSNIINLYKDILGIRNVTTNWAVGGKTQEKCIEFLDDLINLRHDIAHGKNERINELSIDVIREKADFLNNISICLYQFVKNETDALANKQALKYSLLLHCFKDIIIFAVKSGDDTISLEKIRQLGTSAQGNHNKLRYKPWGLLEFIDPSNRKITQKLLDFYNGNIMLPCEILVFNDNDSTEAPGTRWIHFSDLP